LVKKTPAKLKYAVRKVEEYIKLQRHGAADTSRIALGEAYEVRQWSKKFKIIPAKLKAAAAAAGDSSKKVEAYLAAQKTAAKKVATKTTRKTAERGKPA
jgi:hypothetical protein